jgi:hypothetical protein
MEHRIKILPSQWTYADFVKFTDALTRKQDYETAYKLAETMVIEWDYDIELRPGAIKLLPLVESTKVLRTVLDMLEALSQDINTDGVEVSFSKWTLVEMSKYLALKAEGKAEATLRMLQDIIKVDGKPLGEPDTVSAVLGMQINKAVADEYAKMLKGEV